MSRQSNTPTEEMKTEQPKTLQKKPDFILKDEIEAAKKYCVTLGIDFSHGQVFRSGNNEISLPYFMAAYAHDYASNLLLENQRLQKEVDELREALKLMVDTHQEDRFKSDIKGHAFGKANSLLSPKQ